MAVKKGKGDLGSPADSLEAPCIDDFLDPRLKLWRVDKELKQLFPGIGAIIQIAYPNL